MQASCYVWPSMLSAIGLLLSGHLYGDGKKDKPMLHKARNVDASYKTIVKISKGVNATGDLQIGLTQAAKQSKPVLVAFVGSTDIKSNRDFVAFSQARVKDTLNKYVIVVLYADFVPSTFFDKATSHDQRSAEGKANYAFEGSVFKTQQIPLYATITPVGDSEFTIASQYEKALSDDPDEFVKFLDRP